MKRDQDVPRRRPSRKGTSRRKAGVGLASAPASSLDRMNEPTDTAAECLPTEQRYTGSTPVDGSAGGPHTRPAESQARGHAEPGSATEAQFRGLLEAAPDAIVITSRDGRITLVNRQTQVLFGYAREELIGQRVETLIPERYHTVHIQHRQDYSSSPHTRPMGPELELFGRRKDGSEFPVEVSLSALPSPDGMHFLSAIRDVSQRKQIEAALRQAQREAAARAGELETTIEAMADGLVIYDTEAHIVRLNAAARAIFARAVPTDNEFNPLRERAALLVLRDAHGQLLPSEGWPSSRILRGEVLGGVDALDVQLDTLDGRDLYVNIGGAPIRNASGQITGAVAVMRDVTEQR
jgi:PAS domain S-box-containing protein